MMATSKRVQQLPSFSVGSNYWPSDAGIYMWSRWNPEKIRQDLQRMKNLNFNVHRAFIMMTDFRPEAGRTEPVMLERLKTYLNMCEEVGLPVMLTIFAGHMSGQNWEVDWREGRNFFTDPELLNIEDEYVADVVSAASVSPALVAWVLSNEISNYEPRGSSGEITAWTARMVAIVRNLDPHRPISLGDGCWSAEVSRREPEYQLRKLAPLQDFLGIHFYPRPDNPWHQAFTSAFRLQLAKPWGRPVMVEEFGHSRSMGSDTNQAHYYRTVLYSALINGAMGAMNWCFSDVELADDPPYNHHPFEMRFGLVRSDGTVTPAGEEMREFSLVAQELSQGEWAVDDKPAIGLFIPASYAVTNPFDWDSDFDDWYSLYLHTFSLLKRANLDVKCIFEASVEGQDSDPAEDELFLDPQMTPMIIIPRAKRITAPAWKKLLRYVDDGGILYASFAQDHWLTDWESAFGIKSDLRFGLPVQPEGTDLNLSIRNDWLKMVPDEGMAIPIGVRSVETAYCPVTRLTAEVLVNDDHDRPVLVRKSRGKGHLYFSLFPIEMILLEAGDHPASLFWGQVLGRIWHDAVPESNIRVTGPDLEWKTYLNSQTGRIKVVILNHAWEPRSGVLHFGREHVQASDSTLAKSTIPGGGIKFQLDTKGALVINLEPTRANGMIQPSQEEVVEGVR